MLRSHRGALLAGMILLVFLAACSRSAAPPAAPATAGAAGTAQPPREMVAAEPKGSPGAPAQAAPQANPALPAQPGISANPGAPRPAAPAPQQGAPARPATGPAGQAQPAAPAPNLAPGPGAPQTARYYHLLAPPQSLVAADFALGPLQDLLAPAAGLEGLAATLRGFLDGLVAGKLPEALILKGRKPMILAIVGPLLEGGTQGDEGGGGAFPRPVSWRLGRIQTASDSAIASLAVYAPVVDPSGNLKLPPRALGEIRARYVAGSWYVTDISLPTEGPGLDRSLPEGPFEPPVGSQITARGN